MIVITADACGQRAPEPMITTSEHYLYFHFLNFAFHPITQQTNTPSARRLLPQRALDKLPPAAPIAWHHH
jgi:hypothetical protein